MGPAVLHVTVSHNLTGSEDPVDSKRPGVLRRIINLTTSGRPSYKKRQDAAHGVIPHSHMPCALDRIPQSPQHFTTFTAQPEIWEAHLTAFLRVCETLGKDNQGEKAQEFVDRLDEVWNPETTTSDSLTTHLGSR